MVNVVTLLMQYNNILTMTVHVCLLDCAVKWYLSDVILLFPFVIVYILHVE